MGRFKQDALLMQQVAVGNREAQEAVMRRLRTPVHVVSSSILGHPQDAEDATQSALIQILRRAGTFRGDSRLEAWATRLTAREAIRLAQERRLRAARLASEEEGAQVAEHSPVELAPEIPGDIRRYLSDLPEALRNVLVLRHVLGYTVPEIGDILETSPNTVKDRLSRARQAMRKAIKRQLLSAPARKIGHS